MSNDDIIDVYVKSKQRGLSFLLSKFRPHSLSRTTSTFNQAEISHSNRWITPQARKRQNKLISRNENIIYDEKLS